MKDFLQLEILFLNIFVIQSGTEKSQKSFIS